MKLSSFLKMKLYEINYSGGRTALNMESQWQYRGNPPVSRTINGTVHAFYPEWGLQHFTAGCWGTLGFFRSIFRAVNIPVKKESHDGHAQPYFISEGVYLSHGDDPYHGLAKATPLPVEESHLAAEESLLPHSELLLTNLEDAVVDLKLPYFKCFTKNFLTFSINSSLH